MKLLAAIASISVLFGYFALMRADPMWDILTPRGGVVMLGVSLAIANGAIWAATQADRSLSMRFQLAVAGWLWIAAQAAGLAYIYSQINNSSLSFIHGPAVHSMTRSSKNDKRY